MLARAWLVLVMALAACVTDDGPRGPVVTSHVQRLIIPVAQPRALDLLFVIDDSPAMAPYRERIRTNAARFIGVLQSLQGGLPSLHLGVVATDAGGNMRTSPRVDGPFLADVRYQSQRRTRNYEGELRDVFAELADVGSTGSAYVRALDAIRLALDNPANAGFVRDDATLAVIVITASDDCSFGPSFAPVTTHDPAEAAAQCYVHPDDLVDVTAAAQALRARHADPSKVIVGAVSGPEAPIVLHAGEHALEIGPACADELGGATAAPRLHALLRQFPNRSTSTPLCQENLTDVLSVFGGLPISHLVDPCFAAPLLVPAECDVVDQLPDGTQRRIPACDGGTERCWAIVPDPLNCPTPPGAGMRLDVTPFDEPFPAGLSILAECVSADR